RESRFPLENLTLDQFLERATAAQLCEQSRAGASSGFEEWHRGRAMAAIGARLPREKLSKLINGFIKISDPRVRVDVLTMLLSRVPEDSRDQIARLVLSSAVDDVEDVAFRRESWKKILASDEGTDTRQIYNALKSMRSEIDEIRSLLEGPADVAERR